MHRTRMKTLGLGEVTEHVGAQGTTRIERLSRRVVKFTTTGIFTGEAGALALEQTRLVLEEIGTGFCGFYDWGAMTGYEPQVRANATSFVMKHRQQYACAVFLTTSTLVSMGVNVANLVLGGFLQGTTKRDDFEARLKTALAES